jgi:hypothetical protein
MKYIIIRDSGLELPVIFDEIIKHDSFAELNPISAGFVTLEKDLLGNTVAVASGKSISLKKNSRPEDSQIITDSLSRRI